MKKPLYLEECITVNEKYLIKDFVDKYGIPMILKEESLDIPKWMIQYNQNGIEDWTDGCVHFFLDDWRFNSVWSKPEYGLRYMKLGGVALSPDFSLYSDYPYAMQMWNTYRNRWCGAYWQANGVKVIPTIGWADERSYDFCFCGVEKGSVVAVTTLGVLKDKASRLAWLKGYKEMLKRIEPELVLCYGNMDLRYKDLANTIVYPHRFVGIIHKQIDTRVKSYSKRLFDA